MWTLNIIMYWNLLFNPGMYQQEKQAGWQMWGCMNCSAETLSQGPPSLPDQAAARQAVETARVRR